jgi:hypothetical protein
MPKHERGISSMHCQLIQASEWWLAVMSPMRTGDEGRNYILHLFICQHRHRAGFEVTYGKTPTTAQPTKPTVEKIRNRAGATPLFRLSAAQKVLGSLPLTPSSSGPCFFHRSRKAGILPDTESDDL